MYFITKKGSIYKWDYNRLLTNLFKVIVGIGFVIAFIFALWYDSPI